MLTPWPIVTMDNDRLGAGNLKRPSRTSAGERIVPSRVKSSSRHACVAARTFLTVWSSAVRWMRATLSLLIDIWRHVRLGRIRPLRPPHRGGAR
jgi:hypothetical protein